MTYKSELIKENYYRISTSINGEDVEFDCVVTNESELDDVVKFTIDHKTKQSGAYVPSYAELRKAEYPPMQDYLDGIVKNDQAQIDSYIAACQAVKDKYPKP